MSVPTRHRVLQTYRTMLRAAKQFPVYSFREHALRRTREEFRTNKDLVEPDRIMAAFQRKLCVCFCSHHNVVILVLGAEKELGVMQRQATIQTMYIGEAAYVSDTLGRRL